jgi:hypothetical protein
MLWLTEVRGPVDSLGEPHDALPAAVAHSPAFSHTVAAVQQSTAACRLTLLPCCSCRHLPLQVQCHQREEEVRCGSAPPRHYILDCTTADIVSDSMLSQPVSASYCGLIPAASFAACCSLDKRGIQQQCALNAAQHGRLETPPRSYFARATCCLICDIASAQTVRMSSRLRLLLRLYLQP